jgi:putative peptide zinc metalloprotease protein
VIDTHKQLAIQQQRMGELAVKAGAEGRFVLAAAPADDLPGRFVHKGDLIGYVTPGYAEVARVAVGQDDADLVRDGLRGVSFRLANLPGRSFTGKVVRMVPEATTKLPSKALTTGNGGLFPADPRDSEGRTALSRVFLFDIALPPELRRVPFGTRVHVRFRLGWEPLGWQMMRRVRQMFLARFDA